MGSADCVGTPQTVITLSMFARLRMQVTLQTGFVPAVLHAREVTGAMTVPITKVSVGDVVMTTSSVSSGTNVRMTIACVARNIVHLTPVLQAQVNACTKPTTVRKVT